MVSGGKGQSRRPGGRGHGSDASGSALTQAEIVTTVAPPDDDGARP